MLPIQIARTAMTAILGQVSARALGYTTYCAAVIDIDGRRAVLVATAGASAPGIPDRILQAVESALPGLAVIGCATPVAGLGTWHMNDAEQQALRVLADGYPQATLLAVKASRPVCASCSHTLGGKGLAVHVDEAC